MPYVDPVVLAHGTLVTAGTFNQYTVHNVRALKGWQDAHVLHTGFPYVSITNTTAETPFFSAVIPAGAMGTKGWLKAAFTVLYYNNTGATRTCTIRVKLGSTTLWTINEPAGTHASSRYIWYHELFLQNAGAANSQIWEGMWRQPGLAAAGTTTAATPQMLWNTASVDTSIENTLTVTGQWDAASTSLKAELIAADLFGPFPG